MHTLVQIKLTKGEIPKPQDEFHAFFQKHVPDIGSPFCEPDAEDKKEWTPDIKELAGEQAAVSYPNGQPCGDCWENGVLRILNSNGKNTIKIINK